MAEDDDTKPVPQTTVLKRPAATVDAARVVRANAEQQIVASARASVAPLTVDQINQGDVLWLNIRRRDGAGAEQLDERPWIVISQRSRMHKTQIGLVVAVPLTKQIHKVGGYRVTRIAVPPEYITTTDDRFKKVQCLALPEHVRSLDFVRCEGRVGQVDPSVVSSIRAGVRHLIGS